jgi:hypothetical protein
MKVLFCGSRNWTWPERAPIEREIKKLPLGTVIVHGDAPGVDSIVDIIAKDLGYSVRAYPADWGQFGRAAGPIRNAEMLRQEHRAEEPIDKCVAFSKDFDQSRGTKDMMTKCRKKFIPVEAFSE